METVTIHTQLEITTVRECCGLVFVLNAKKPIHSLKPAALCKDINAAVQGATGYG